MTTFTDYQSAESSEKILLCKTQASRHLIGFTLDSGVLYKLTDFNESVIVSIKEASTSLTEVSSKAAIVAGSFFNDKSNQELFLQAIDSGNPNGDFLILTSFLFFSNVGIALSSDLSIADDVYWLPLIRNTSQFGVNLDRQNQIGFAIEGSGSISFFNDKDFWKSRYEKLSFINKRIEIFQYNRGLDVTEAQLIFRGTVQDKSYSFTDVKFTLKDLFNALRNPITLSSIDVIAGERTPEDLKRARQRQIYGKVTGFRPTNIDQVLDTGYPLTGTVTTSGGNTTVTGTGTAFLAELNPDDRLLVSGRSTELTVASVTSNTSLELTEASSFTALVEIFTVLPSLGKRFANREWVLSGHALREPTTTVTTVVSTNLFRIADDTDFEAGAQISIGSQIGVIRRVSGNQIRLETNLLNLPVVSETVKRLTVSNLFIDDRLMVFSEDYTYNASTGRLTLDTLAEFNRTEVRELNGSITFNGTRAVTGTSSTFKSQLNSNSWIRLGTESTLFEVLSIESNTALTLRIAATYSGTGASKYKRPEVFVEGDNVITCEIIGATEDGTTSGTWIKTGAQIVKDLVTKAGLSDDLDDASFTTSEGIAPYTLGMVIPESFEDKTSDTLRDLVNKVNVSIFGSLVQDSTFKIKYDVLSPRRPETFVSFEERDFLSFDIKSKGSRTVKSVALTHTRKEYDKDNREASSQLEEVTSQRGEFLLQSDKLFEVDTIIRDTITANIIAERYAFIFSEPSSVINFRTKLQASTLSVNDLIKVSHRFMYEKPGSLFKTKIAAIQSVKKNEGETLVEIEDLGNTFTRAGAITDDGDPTFADSEENDLLTSGYITDEFGMISGDKDTVGLNLIF